MSFEKQVLVLYAALNDYFNGFKPEEMQVVEAKFLDYFDNLHKDLVAKIKEERQNEQQAAS
jgi:F0F1-type ATP synthase alpha subunit